MSCVCGYLVYVEYDKFKHELEFVDCHDFVTQNLAMTGKGKSENSLTKPEFSVNLKLKVQYF